MSSSMGTLVLAVDTLAVAAAGPPRLEALAVLLDALGVLAAAALLLHLGSR